LYAVLIAGDTGITENARSLRRLRTACERAKRLLSSATTASIEVDALIDGIDYQATLSRAKFEDLCADIFGLIVDPIERVLADAKIAKSQVDEIVLVRGAYDSSARC
jgi:L1 cell adhesion molecule like protein